MPDDEQVGITLDLARVLAHVTTHDGAKRVMQAAGWKSFPGERTESEAGEDRPVLSHIRFRRLLTTSAGEPLVAAFVRLVGQLDSEVNVDELATDFRDWSHPVRGPSVRNKWAFDYYAAGIAAPSPIDSSTDDEAEL